MVDKMFVLLSNYKFLGRLQNFGYLNRRIYTNIEPLNFLKHYSTSVKSNGLCKKKNSETNVMNNIKHKAYIFASFM
jgi:hypothetical protein